MSKEIRIIVARVEIERWEEQEREMVPGSSIDICHVCEESVWLSPEGQRFAYHEAPGEVEIICTDCHIRLEIERRKGKEGAKPIPTVAVPGASIPVAPEIVRQWRRDTEQQIKEGLEGGPSST